MQLIYNGFIEIPDSELATFLEICLELKIAGLPVFNAERPFLDNVHIESLTTSSNLPANISLDAELPGVTHSATGFQFERGENPELPMDQNFATGKPAELESSPGFPSRLGTAGLSAEQGSSTGLQVKMEEDESFAAHPKRPRFSVSEGAINVHLGVIIHKTLLCFRRFYSFLALSLSLSLATFS